MIKHSYPDTFRINQIHYGYYKGEMLNVLLIFGNNDFAKLNDEQVNNLVALTKLSIKLTFLSMISVPIIIILTGLIK